MSISSSSFSLWVPDRNLNKSLEPMSEIPCKYFLYSKSSFNSLYMLSIYCSHTFQNATYIPVTKFLNALSIQNTASSKVEVRSISLTVISKTHFFHCFLFLPGILFLFHSFSKTFSTKTILTLFSIILKTKLLFSCFFLNLKDQYLSHPMHTA